VSGLLDLVPVGVVRSPIRNRAEMPLQGVHGEIVIFPTYREALDGIDSNSHLILIGWMHHAKRDVLTARARKVAPDLPEKGVFALRSPSRPNPLSFSVVRLVKRRNEGVLTVSLLDLIDGTPIIDIKPYQPGWDAVFSATTHDRSEKILKMGPARYRESLIREAVNYHGEWCSGAAMAVRISEKATELAGGDLRRQAISIDPGTNPCRADSLIGITGSRPGNGRLVISQSRVIRNQLDQVTFFGHGRAWVFTIKPVNLSPEGVIESPEKDLFFLETLPR